MSETYQPIFDAVRSKISGGNIGDIVAEQARSALDISHQVEMVKHEFICAAMEYQRPSVMFRPALTLDGNKYCALYGDDLQSGCAGFGDSVEEAMRDFDKNWTAKLPQGGAR